MKAGCLAVFSLVIFSCSFIYLCLGISGWVEYCRTEDWKPTPASILDLKLEKDPRSTHSDVYQVYCQYRYVVEGKEYISYRVDISNEASQDFSYHSKLYESLKKHRDAKDANPLPAFVNPDAPQEAILFRDIDVGTELCLPLGLFFMTISGFALLLCLAGLWRRISQASRRLLFNETPWMAESKWNSLRIWDSANRSLLPLWALSLFLCFVSFFTVCAARGAPAVVWAVPLLFILVAFGGLACAIHRTRRRLIYGCPVLAIEHVPILLGEDFVAVVGINKQIYPESGVLCSLICESVLQQGKIMLSRTQITELYREDVVVHEDLAAAAEGRSVIPIAFTIPADKPQRDVDCNPAIKWKIALKAITPGVNFSAEFSDLPIYRANSDNRN